MFYPCRGGKKAGLGAVKRAEKETRAVICLTPSESKRLIAKAIAKLPEVKQALETGKVIISLGTTNAFVAEEILGISLPKAKYAGGLINSHGLSALSAAKRLRPFVLIEGKAADISIEEALRGFSADDVYIKGANAEDQWGNAGILVGHETGGTTVGKALPILLSRGSVFLIPVGLEKLVPSVIEASQRCPGLLRVRQATGLPVGLMPVVNAKVVTEIQALEFLCGVSAFHIASGGVFGAEGSIVLALEGTESRVTAAFELVCGIKGEPHINAIRNGDEG
ncbi:MAG: hypothetical protein MUP49_01185 [Dehalococcoidia bacterium]|nr:hypothetical protein [Dehalococcoidia bacterium]